MRFVSAGPQCAWDQLCASRSFGQSAEDDRCQQSHRLGCRLYAIWAGALASPARRRTISGFPASIWIRRRGTHYNYFRDYDPTTGRYVQSDPIGLEYSFNTYSYVDLNPVRWIDRNGLFKLPSNPSGLSPDWQFDPSHQDPNGTRLRHPNGDYLDFHHGRPGEPGEKAKDHWHHNGGKDHLKPGDDVPDPENDSNSSEFCEVAQKAIVGVGGAYAGYRIIRLLPSLVPPLWWTIPPNLATP